VEGTELLRGAGTAIGSGLGEGTSIGSGFGELVDSVLSDLGVVAGVEVDGVSVSATRLRRRRGVGVSSLVESTTRRRRRGVGVSSLLESTCLRCLT
jgi:hypothetical protein